MFVGAVGRPDLPGHAREHAATLYESIRKKLLVLPETLEIYPAHFAGSACGAGMSGKPTTTIAFEKRFNPKLSMDRDEFVADVVKSAPAKPAGMDAIVRFNQGRSG
jgi:glyoxylase-like metal-dependent hydrolase (beta-lactamase superfamily II)